MPTAEERIQQLKEISENAPETRSHRMQILVTKTMFDTIQALADETKVSKNEIVNQALTEYLTK